MILLKSLSPDTGIQASGGMSPLSVVSAKREISSWHDGGLNFKTLALPWWSNDYGIQLLIRRSQVSRPWQLHFSEGDMVRPVYCATSVHVKEPQWSKFPKLSNHVEVLEHKIPGINCYILRIGTNEKKEHCLAFCWSSCCAYFSRCCLHLLHYAR